MTRKPSPDDARDPFAANEQEPREATVDIPLTVDEDGNYYADFSELDRVLGQMFGKGKDESDA